MNKAPFFISPPRTRSSVLFQLMEFYALQKIGLKPLHNHIELFLNYSFNNIFTDLKTGETGPGELHPVIRGDGLHIHFMYPYMFKTGVDRNLHKLSVLKQAKSAGQEYFIKGTINIIDTAEEVIDFFSDKHIVITKRRNTEEHALSYLYARASKLFNAREFNVDMYMEKLRQGVTIDETLLTELGAVLKKIKQVYDLEDKLISRNIDYTVTYYEDMEDYNQLFDTVTKIYGTSEWLDFLPTDFEKFVPIKVEKDYSKSILNYDEIINTVRTKIKESGLE